MPPVRSSIADITAATVTTGLLRMCNPYSADAGPCVDYISTSPDG
ncbi:MAG TPA: hypothetical protein VMU09_13870 [Acidimicrobiales bacterium]|nr:hypothetical protein [Acidimicrobiales bacterium]